MTTTRQMKADHWFEWIACVAGPVASAAVVGMNFGAHYYAGVNFGVFCDQCWDLAPFDAPLV